MIHLNRVIFDMKNQNSLISLAYIKISDNPLHVFCHYILYVLLKEPAKELRADILKDRLFAKFGLNMPQQLINNCVRLLEQRGEVVRLPHGAGYRVSETNFDLDVFENTIQKLQEHENTVLESLTAFVNQKYRKVWTKEEARNYLSAFLGKEGYGAQLFLQKELKIEGKQASPSVYIGRYVDYLQKQPECLELRYLEELVNGMMVLQGISQTGDYQQNKNQKFKGTVFYFDTKLVLRALGFSWKAQVDSVREMVRLLREKYEAKIGIFPQTLTEVENALATAGSSFQKGRPIRDLELKLYSELYPTDAAMLLDFSSVVPGLLKRELGIDEPTRINWDKPEARKYNIDVKTIADYIEDQCGWRRGAIDNDVEVINQINILRKADYTRQYGGKEKLPVFVTSNSKLAYTFRDYITGNEENGKGWSSHALPVISDNMLLYRVWLPFATEHGNLPALTLSRFAYSAQSEGIVFYEKFRSIASALDKTKNVDLVNVTEATRRKVEDILMMATDGDPEQMTEEVVATSFDEYVRLEKLHLTEENTKLSKQKEGRDSQVIKLLSQKYINKLGPRRLLLPLSKLWWLFAFAALFAATSAISDNVYLRSISFIPLAVQLVQFAVDKLFDDRGWRFSLYNKAIAYVKREYIKKIERGLEKDGYETDKEAVIAYCLSCTKVFNKNT